MEEEEKEKNHPHVYIRGVRGREDEVRKLLEGYGGKHNPAIRNYGNPYRYFFIDGNYIIRQVITWSYNGERLEEVYKEVFLPNVEEKPIK